MIWLGAFAALVALLMLWALVIAPGRARKLFGALEAQGWRKVPAGDEAVRSALAGLAGAVMRGPVEPLRANGPPPADGGRRPRARLHTSRETRPPEGRERRGARGRLPAA